MAERFVESRIRDDAVTLFVVNGCPYCRNAVDLLRNYNFRPGGLQVCDITGLGNVQDYFQQTAGQRAVPRVFIGRQCIGGFSDLQSMGGRLPGILHRIGALQ